MAPKAATSRCILMASTNRANIWLNGQMIAGAKESRARIAPTNSTSLRCSCATRPNMLAVETIAPTEQDLGINWVDWNPTPPDKNMGLWRGVYLRSTGPVEIRYPQVVTHFPGATLAEADLTVEAELRNAGSTAVTGTYRSRNRRRHASRRMSRSRPARSARCV